MVTGYFNSADIQALSKLVFLAEDSAWSENDWMNYEDCEAHPLVLSLLGEHGNDGIAGALAYLAEKEDEKPDVGAVIRWMIAGAYKGPFEDEAAFCEDQFADAIADHMEEWTNSHEVGFPSGVDWGEAIDWEYIAGHLQEQVIRGDDTAVFHFIETNSGLLHVFDASIDVEPGPLGTCEWIAVCAGDAVKLIPHPAFPDGVPTCERHVAFAEAHLPEARRIHEG